MPQTNTALDNFACRRYHLFVIQIIALLFFACTTSFAKESSSELNTTKVNEETQQITPEQLDTSRTPIESVKELPRQYITDSPWVEEFSDRTTHAPFQKLTPQPLQITSPNFETLFQGSTAVQARTQGSPATSIRGSSQAARVLYLLNNIPLNFLDGFGGSSQFVPTEILRQINIFEGPTSALYGANALGGSIHFVADQRKNSLVRIGLSDTDTSYAEGGPVSTSNVALVTPLLSSEKDHIQFSAFAEHDRDDFPYTTATGAKNRRAQNDQQLQRFTLLGNHRRDRWKWSHLLLYSDLRKTSPGSLILPLKTDQKSKALLAGVTSEYKPSSESLWISRLSYAGLHSDFLDTTASTSNSDKLWLSQAYSWQIFSGVLSQTVLDFNHNLYKASFARNERFERTEPELAQSLTIPVFKSAFLEPTVRHLFRYKETLFQLNAPAHFEHGRVWFLYSEGFRPPSLTDLYAQTSYFVGNQNLKPEYSQQYEVGQAWNVDAIEISSSLFLLKYKDLLQGSVLPTSEFTKINVGQAQTYGISAKVQINQPQWNSNLSHTYMLARELPSRTPLRFSPEHQTFFSFNYLLSTKRSLTLQQTLWSSIWDLDFINNRNTRLPAWSSTDILLSQKINKLSSLQLGIYNLFNQRREMTFGYPEPQRRAALALEMTF